MRKTTKIIAFILVLMFVFALCGCGKKTDDAGNASSGAAVQATEAPDYSGTYTSFGMKSAELGDYIIDTDGFLDMSFTLNNDGSGKATNDNEDAPFTWTVSGETLTINNENGESMTGTIKNGVIEITIDENGTSATVYLAKEGADKSSYNVMSITDVITAMSATE